MALMFLGAKYVKTLKIQNINHVSYKEYLNICQWFFVINILALVTSRMYNTFYLAEKLPKLATLTTLV